ncbi:MAG TPA: serine/threonine-protein kinase [Thermoanaerobaculia bacterium]|nr:serine/threonine-protein kinase [Thermoanaerobaculia bacterium]
MPLSPTKNPTRLGRYEILDELGKGAMGVVYLAKDPLIGRLVALKTFRIGYSLKDQEMEQFRARFMREAQSAGILSHPNIVTIHDVVEESEEGLAFIAMEYVRGTNLKMLLQRETPLDLVYVAGILEQIADGLDYAHSKGVVHRDVKPANIIITADNRAKITDFGIARIDTSNLTQEGQLLGTPNYMAPEQILGREVDHRADIFSLGVVLYEMLTRHKPFQGENLTVVSHRIVYDHFTPPKDYVGNLPRGVEPILARVLDKEPGRRYQRASEMAADLSRLVSERLASESLNETLSLSSMMTAVSAAPGAPGAPGGMEAESGTGVAMGTGDGMGTDSGSGSTISATPLRSSRARLAPWLIGVALLLVAAGMAGWLWTAWRQPRKVAPPRVSAVPIAPVQRAVPAPDPAVAVAAAQLAEQARRVQRQKEIDDRLGQAREALTGKRYDEAVAAASAVLALDPGNPDARGIVAAVDKAEQRRNDRAAQARAAVPPRPKPADKLPPVSLPKTTPMLTVVAPVPTEATLSVNLYSNLPDGVLVVYVNNSQVMLEPFSFWKKINWLRSEPKKGTVRKDIPVPVGTADIRIYVTYSGKRTEVKNLSGNFPGGAVRALNATLNEDGSLTARLE